MADHRSDAVPEEVISKLIEDALADPGLPRAQPTEAFWQIPASDISTIQSAELPSKTKYAIIGSGITACSVAQNILTLTRSDPDANVTVFEARTLCSGATGRNGGHLLSPMPEEFTRIEKYFGVKEATGIAEFANMTLDRMHGLNRQDDLATGFGAEVRRVRSVCGYWDEEIFEAAKQSHARYEQCLPKKSGDHEAFGPEEAREKFNMKDAVGVITSSAGAFWPYRLITGLFKRLLEQYTGRFSFETETPVTSVKHHPASNAEYPYILTTPRGTIRATMVIHCTNGWTGHLLPKLRGKIFPLRATMSVQAAGPDFQNEGNHKSWSTIDKPTYDAADNTLSYGLYYITQNAHTGDIFIGGEKQFATEVLSSDDTNISTISKDKLESVLPTIFEQGWPQGGKPKVKSIWSGIMGFTPDHLPWVGQIPETYTECGANGEYIAAGFNGYGMPLCWGCGEALAKMVVGENENFEKNAWLSSLPGSFLITKRRLESPYTSIEAGIAGLLEQPLTWAATLRLLWQGLRSIMHQNLLAKLG
ncbi:hypothetical protein CLAFUW4_14087 [Fulvia fulva]|uniref:FAD dependent oxidoreductase domain-containing protein n=1 Tax=Passalora fulva TaxID=5499 RepID=A0A9Q8UW74_PASFU|nr:uncharacterized protein CLAFUR5_13922 [Fulvia fulva]KAK4610377.1 hypothetical protein CLAFUR4_14090 [Fulvia fulva]KAK4610853.1 hypothetical protein CLAFUR0_14094 [Fulvia fulva]UJO24716.1 hypothetical protein CLAFUR5_13922 [Fulvia fulva]WPV21999.1 hypothetical protein CLAFUW4_14087 [Fulvia fulva]WPV37182.1 hypothetical protein CLAFUW7_14098 [Fulvia fulva]